MSKRIGIDDTGLCHRVGTGWIFVPYFRILLDLGNGLEDLPDDMRACIEYCDIQTEESGGTTLEFKVQDPNFTLLNSSMFTHDIPVYFEWGWANDWNYIQRKNLFIAGIEPSFTDKGYPSLTITCMDETHLMNREEKTRTFENMKRSTIAKYIFQEYGMDCYVEDSGEQPLDVEEKITQSNKTDIKFLQDIAEDVVGTKFICYVEDGKGYFCRRDFAQEPVLDFHYRDGVGNDISSFSCNINKESVKQYKTSGDIDLGLGLGYVDTCYYPTKNTKTQTDTRIIGNERQKTQEEIEREQQASEYGSSASSVKPAEDKFDDVQYEVCEGTMSPVVAIPLIPSRKCINILGVGAALSGKYYIKSVGTTIDQEGITQSLELRKSEFFGSIRLTDDSRDDRPSALVR